MNAGQNRLAGYAGLKQVSSQVRQPSKITLSIEGAASLREKLSLAGAVIFHKQLRLAGMAISREQSRVACVFT